MKFAILGSGAVGGYYGAKLARAGHDVTFIARGAHLDAIRRDGLLVKSPLGDFTVQARAESDPADAPAAQLIATVITKSISSAASGTNAQASPYAVPTLLAPPPPSGKRRISWW